MDDWDLLFSGDTESILQMEKRSVRVRKVHNYAHLDGDSDEEFFDDEPPKGKIRATVRGDGDWQLGSDSDNDGAKKETKGSSKTKKHAKKEKPPKTPKTVVITTHAGVETSNSVNQNRPIPSSVASISDPATTFTSSVTPTTSHSPVVMKTPKLNPSTKLKIPQSAPASHCPIGSPVTPSSSSLKAHFAVTPTSALRIGLSRNRKLKPLHSNVRVA